MSVNITFIGHSTVLLDIGGTRVITDPVLRSSLLGAFRRAGEPPPPIDPPPDAVLISHQHPDHLDFPSLRMLGTATPVIAPRGSGRRLRRRGMSEVQELSVGEATRVGEVEITATPAAHDGQRLIGLSAETLGYELSGDGTRIYFAGDTDLFDEMTGLAGIDLALLPIGGIGPSVGAGHLDPERVVKAVELLKPRVVVPIHWGTILRADLHRWRPELLTAPALEFQELMAAHAPDVEARVLQPGESFTLST